MALLTIRAYARHRGVHHTSVLRAVRVGRISLRRDGKIDPVQADRQWKLRTDPTKPRNSVTGDPKHRRHPGAPPSPAGTRIGNPDGEEQGAQVLTNYAPMRAFRETYLARMAKLDYEVAAGKKIDADEVRAQAFETARAARDVLLGLPDRAAPRVARTADEQACHQILQEEVERVCLELAGPLAGHGKPAP